MDLNKIPKLAIALVALLLMFGCGGGGGTSTVRSITISISIDFPKPARAASRVIPGAVQFVLVEVFDGATRIGSQIVGAPTAGGLVPSQLNLPGTVQGKALQFYATAFANPIPTDPATSQPIYKTDPATGLIPPSLYGSNTPLARATVVQIVNINAVTIRFSLNSTIVTFVPASYNPEIHGAAPAQIPTITLALNQDPSLNTHTVNDVVLSQIKAIDANGATVMVAPSELSWAYVSGDTESSNLISFTDSPNNTTIHLNGIGTAFLVVTDSAVSPPFTSDTPATFPAQANIKSTIGITITAPSQTTIAVDPAQLRSATPLYAKSIVFSLTEDALGAGDNPAPATVSQPFDVARFDPVNNTVTLPPVSIPYVASGRTFTLNVAAYSAAGGKGVVIASTSFTNLRVSDLPLSAGGVPTLSKVLFPPSDYQIDGFVVTPVSSSVYFYTGSAIASLPRAVTLQASLAKGGVAVTGPVPVGTVIWTSGMPAIVGVTQASSTDTGETATALSAVSQTSPVTVTVTDTKVTAPAFQGAATVTIQNTAAGGLGQ